MEIVDRWRVGCYWRGLMVFLCLFTAFAVLTKEVDSDWVNGRGVMGYIKSEV